MTDDFEARADVIVAGEAVLPAENIHNEMPFFIDQLGFQLDEIFPTDDPCVAVLSGHGLRIRLDRNANCAPGLLIVRCTHPEEFAKGERALTSPSGTRVEVMDANPPLETPTTDHSFIVRRLKDSDSWVIGRAGMHYRDLIPDRLGGSIIASHIRIPEGGPVPDMVHYHTVGVQLIFCLNG
ncbi:MAG: cupin domain-containing protein, partial [Hyphomicrobiales bacterium]